MKSLNNALRTLAIRLGISILWLFHKIPLSVLAFLGSSLGYLIYLLPTRRRKIAERNLALCFPEVEAAERQRWVRLHFSAYARAALEHTVLLWGSKEQIQKMVCIKGIEHFLGLGQRPIIVFAPHFVGLDAGGIRLSIQYPGTSMYSRQSHPLIDGLLRRSRERFGTTKLVLRNEGIRPLIRNIKAGLPAYYLPDMDLGREGALFIPFFGIPAATIPALSRLAKLTNAIIVPCITWQEPHGRYCVEFFPPWFDWKGDNPLNETQRMNTFIENQIRRAPWQYLWTHQRFKTRPHGEASVYL